MSTEQGLNIMPITRPRRSACPTVAATDVLLPAAPVPDILAVVGRGAVLRTVRES